MKYIISYKPRHKEVLENAISISMSWHEGNINPVCELLMKTYQRHHPYEENLVNASQYITDRVTSIRSIDSKGLAFGDYEVLKGIKLDKSGETTIFEDEEWALEHMSEIMARLRFSQVNRGSD